VYVDYNHELIRDIVFLGIIDLLHGVSRGESKNGTCPPPTCIFFEKIKFEKVKEMYQISHEPGYR
jgi:hypothetical protein